MTTPKIGFLTFLACSLAGLTNTQSNLSYCTALSTQPCLTSCSDPKFADCPDNFIQIFDPKFCGLTKDREWRDYTFQCQACQASDVAAVVGQKCSCQFTGCQLGQICLQGICITPKISCASILCLEGTQCIEGVGCVPIETANPCSLCKDYQFCSIDNVCIDNCAFIKCTAGHICQKGACIVDPCADIICSQGQQCINGQCSFFCGDFTCLAGDQCIDGQCRKHPIDPLPIDQCKGKCLDWQRCFQGQCRDQCQFLRCANCFRGQCGVIDKCSVVQCKKGEKCVDGQCVPVDQCKGKCLDWQYCFQGQCRDQCQFMRCANCFRGQCGVIDKCSVVQCKKGEKCVDGQCFNDNSCTEARKIYCKNPRPTKKNCPTLTFIKEPDPVVCGVDKFGNREDYPVTCYACRDKKNVFYFDVPCAQVKNKNKCGQFQECVNGKCIIDPEFCNLEYSSEDHQLRKQYYNGNW